MGKRANEKIIDISGQDGEDVSRKPDVQRTRKKKKSRFFSNLLTVLAVIGLIVGSTILGKTLWDEYNRIELTKAFIQQAEEKLEKHGSRADFHPQEGDVVGLIIFPQRDNLTVPIIEGIREQDLYAGIGHYEQTGWPTDQRQIFLAGHRNTEFGVLQDVVVGEQVIVQTMYGNYTYQITAPPNDGVDAELKYAGRIVHETQVEVINPAPTGAFERDQLVLMTCYPFTFGASLEHRFLLYGERIN